MNSLLEDPELEGLNDFVQLPLNHSPDETVQPLNQCEKDNMFQWSSPASDKISLTLNAMQL